MGNEKISTNAAVTCEARIAKDELIRKFAAKELGLDLSEGTKIGWWNDAIHIWEEDKEIRIYPPEDSSSSVEAYSCKLVCPSSYIQLAGIFVPKKVEAVRDLLVASLRSSDPDELIRKFAAKELGLDLSEGTKIGWWNDAIHIINKGVETLINLSEGSPDSLTSCTRSENSLECKPSDQKFDLEKAKAVRDLLVASPRIKSK